MIEGAPIRRGVIDDDRIPCYAGQISLRRRQAILKVAPGVVIDDDGGNVVQRRLRAGAGEPLCRAGQALAERDAWLPAEDSAGEGDIRPALLILLGAVACAAAALRA